MPSSKIQYTSLDPQVLGGVAQEETSQEINNNIKSLYNTVGSAENSDNSLYGKIDNILQKTSQQLSILNGGSTPFGTGYMGDIVISSSNYVFPANDSYGRCIIQCKSFTLNEGVTLTVPQCTGFYIFATENITINGTLVSKENNLYGSTYTEDFVDYIEVNKTKCYLAKGGMIRDYNGTITKNSTSVDINGYTGNSKTAINTTLNAINFSNTDKSATMHVSGGNSNPAKYTFTKGYAKSTASTSDKNYAKKTTQPKMNSSTIRYGSASIVLVSPNIIMSGTIDTSSTSYSNSPTIATASWDDFYDDGGSSSSTWGITFNDSYINSTINLSSASGGITIIGNTITINGICNTKCGSTTIGSATQASQSFNKTGIKCSSSLNVTSHIKVTTGSVSITGDTIIGIPGEIKIYELGGE